MGSRQKTHLMSSEDDSDAVADHQLLDAVLEDVLASVHVNG